MIISNKIYIHSYDKKDNIIFNGINGALDIINKDVAYTLKTRNLDIKIINALKNRGYIFETIDEKTRLEESVYNNYLKLTKNEPFIFSICPTLKCNLQCVYCFEQDVSKRKESLTNDMVESIFSVIKQKTLHTNKSAIIELYGGEPLLEDNYEINSKIFESVVKNNYNGINIITNGVNLDKYEKLITKYPGVVKNIQITIDGPEEIHDKRRCSKDGNHYFKKIINNIKSTLDLGILITVRINVDKNNIDYISNLMDFFEDKFVFYDNFKCYLTQVTSNNSEFKECISEFDLVKLIEEISHNRPFILNEGPHLLKYIQSILNNETIKILPRFNNCEATCGTYMAFCPDGKIYPCSETVGIDKFAIGKYYPSVELNEYELKKWTNNSVISRKSCKECTISLLCGGGCSLNNFYNTNNLSKSCHCKNNFIVLENYLNEFKIKRGLK